MVDIERTCERLHRYIETYYRQLRQQFANYSSIETAFPGFLRGYKRVQVLLCSDGVLVVHWSADQDSFACEARQQTVRNVVKEISGPGFVYDYPPGDPGAIDFAEAVIYEVTGNVRKLTYHSPWDKLEIDRRFGSARWGVTYAGTRANSDALTFVAAHLMRMRQPKDEDVLGRLSELIEEFEDVLEQATREEELQAFLAENPVLLSPTALNVYPKHRLGKEYVCDFVIDQAEADYILVELEAPSHPLFIRGGDPSHQLSHAQQQVENWREWVSQYTDYAQKSLPAIREPDCWIVIGRAESLSGSDRVKLDRRNKELPCITIMTYDDLLGRAQRHVDNLNRLRHT